MSEEKNTYIEETLPNGNIDDLPMMKSKKPVAIILVLICISLAIAAGAVSTRIRHSAEMYGEVDWNDILLTVDQPVEGGILVKVNNRSVSNMNFGWVDNATIILETSEGTYIQKIKRTIGNFSTGYILLAFPQASGVPQSLTFDSVGRGLGADSSFGMDLIIHGDGEKSIKPMNVFEIPSLT